MVTGALPANTTATANQLSEKSEKFPRLSQDSFVDVELGSDQPFTPSRSDVPATQPSRSWSFSHRPCIRLIILLAAIAIIAGTVVTLVLARPSTAKVHEPAEGVIAGLPDGKLIPRHTLALPVATVTPGLHGIDPTLPFDPEALEEFAHRPQVVNGRRHVKDLGDDTVTVMPAPTHVATAIERRHGVHNVTAPSGNFTVPHRNMTKPVSKSSPDTRLEVDTKANSDGGSVGSSATIVGGIIGGIVGLVVLSILLCMWCGGRRYGAHI